jgi:hypothetical protein
MLDFPQQNLADHFGMLFHLGVLAHGSQPRGRCSS